MTAHLCVHTRVRVCFSPGDGAERAPGWGRSSSEMDARWAAKAEGWAPRSAPRCPTGEGSSVGVGGRPLSPPRSRSPRGPPRAGGPTAAARCGRVSPPHQFTHPALFRRGFSGLHAPPPPPQHSAGGTPRKRGAPHPQRRASSLSTFFVPGCLATKIRRFATCIKLCLHLFNLGFFFKSM